MSFITVKFKPNSGGSEFEVKNVEHYTFGVHRHPGANGHLGKKGHDIESIIITRNKSLQDGGKAKLEEEVDRLASAVEQKAYFKGTITLARSDDSTDIIQKVAWDNGHICGLNCSVQGEQIMETLTVCVTELKLNDSTFKRVQTT